MEKMQIEEYPNSKASEIRYNEMTKHTILSKLRLAPQIRYKEPENGLILHINSCFDLAKVLYLNRKKGFHLHEHFEFLVARA
jgi:hypothetical protein